MSKFQKIRANMPRSSAVIATVCILLVVFFAVAQVVHVHAHQSDADHCALCMVLHSVAPISVAVAVIVLVEIGAPAPMPETHIVVRVWHPTLFIRPPPSSLLLPHAI